MKRRTTFLVLCLEYSSFHQITAGMENKDTVTTISGASELLLSLAAVESDAVSISTGKISHLNLKNDLTCLILSS